MRYTGVIATGDVDLDGDRFAEDALEQMAGEVCGKKVLVGFDPRREVGDVVNAWFLDGEVGIAVEASEELAGFYVVPGFLYDPATVGIGEGGGRVFTEALITSVGLTDKPADSSLTPLASQS